MSTNINVPALPESVADATILTWHKKPGDPVQRDENLVDLETDKVVLEVPSPCDGVMGQISVAAGETVMAGDLLGLIEEGASPATAPRAVGDPAPAAQTDGAEPVLTPSVRRLVREMNLDPRLITGTSKDGRIMKSDVMAYLDARENENTGDPEPAPETISDPAPGDAERPL